VEVVRSCLKELLEHGAIPSPMMQELSDSG